MKLIIQGKEIDNERDFHVQLAKLLNIRGYYGCNLDALWDLLSASIERPLCIVWNDSNYSKLKLGVDFEKIINIFELVKQQDNFSCYDEKFDYLLL